MLKETEKTIGFIVIIFIIGGISIWESPGHLGPPLATLMIATPLQWKAEYRDNFSKTVKSSV